MATMGFNVVYIQNRTWREILVVLAAVDCYRYYYINRPFQMYLIFSTEGTKCLLFTHVEYTRFDSNRLNLRFKYDGYNVMRFYRVL
jgi:hypothetical protein